MQVDQLLNIKVEISSENLESVGVSSLFLVAICSGRKAVPFDLLTVVKISTAILKASPKCK